MKTLEIDIGPIHDIERAGLDREKIENGDVVGLSVRNQHETRDIAAQVHQGVQLHRPFVFAKSRPREQAQTEIDRRAVEGVGGLFQFDGQGFVGVECPRSLDQHLGEIGEDPPVVDAIGVG